jgi:hypothetical protein
MTTDREFPEWAKGAMEYYAKDFGKRIETDGPYVRYYVLPKTELYDFEYKWENETTEVEKLDFERREIQMRYWLRDYDEAVMFMGIEEIDTFFWFQFKPTFKPRWF